MSFLNRTKKGEQAVPAKPLVPYIEVTREGFFFSRAILTPHPDYPYTDWRGEIVYRYYLQWRILGSNARAQKVSRRILNRYLRRVSYRNGGAVRIEGKVK